MKYSKIGDSVASEMEAILTDNNFKSVFSPTQEISQESFSSGPYKPFVRVASTDKSEVFKSIVNSIADVSKALDDLGLEKSATVALGLLNGILKEASDWGEDSVPRKGERVTFVPHETAAAAAAGETLSTDYDEAGYPKQTPSLNLESVHDMSDEQLKNLLEVAAQEFESRSNLSIDDVLGPIFKQETPKEVPVFDEDRGFANDMKVDQTINQGTGKIPGKPDAQQKGLEGTPNRTPKEKGPIGDRMPKKAQMEIDLGLKPTGGKVQGKPDAQQKGLEGFSGVNRPDYMSEGLGSRKPTQTYGLPGEHQSVFTKSNPMDVAHNQATQVAINKAKNPNQPAYQRWEISTDGGKKWFQPVDDNQLKYFGKMQGDPRFPELKLRQKAAANTSLIRDKEALALFNKVRTWVKNG